VLAYIWIIGYQGTLTQQASAQQLQERIKIEAVGYSGTNLDVYIRNIGDIQVTIDAVYVINPDGSVNNYVSSLGATLTPGQMGTIQVSGVTLTAGNTYVVKVVTAKGTEATYTWTYRT